MASVDSMNDAPVFATRCPSSPLAAFVERIWLYAAPPRPFAKERMMPSGAATLIVNLFEDQIRNYSAVDPNIVEYFPGSTLTGPEAQPFVIDTAEQAHVMGIEFHPGGTWPFFDPAADELTNRHLSLKDLWGGYAESLRARLLAARTAAEKLLLLEGALLERAIRPLRSHAGVTLAMQALMRAPNVQTVAALSERINVSPRTFSRLFSQQVGFKPKTFARVQRFQQVLKLVGLGREIDWSSVVAQCGYYDQAHFIKDFRSFSGFTPSEYVARRKIDLRHVPLG